jgi:hypothetical protein
MLGKPLNSVFILGIIMSNIYTDTSHDGFKIQAGTLKRPPSQRGAPLIGNRLYNVNILEVFDQRV